MIRDALARTHYVGYNYRSLNASRSDDLKDIHHTFCLETFQLRVDTQECTTANHTITDREKPKHQKNMKELLATTTRGCLTCT